VSNNPIQDYALLCLRFASECKSLAQDVPEADLRARFLRMARMWTELASQRRVLH